MQANFNKPPVKEGVVYIVDDDEAVRDSLTWLLESDGYKVSCHENGERFLLALASSDNATIACALIDIRMSGMTGIELQEKLVLQGFDFPISFITGHGEISMAVHAFKHGAMDFIQKPFKEDAICELVDKMLIKANIDKQKTVELNQITNKFKTLTSREEDVLGRIAVGRTNKEIGTDLNISVKTVEAHRANIMDKLEVNRPAKLLQLILKYQDAQMQGIV